MQVEEAKVKGKYQLALAALLGLLDDAKQATQHIQEELENTLKQSQIADRLIKI